MKQTIGLSQFRDAFFRCNRGEQFSYEALELIFEHLEQYENDCGVEMELDVVAICCEYEESDAEYLCQQYPIFEADVNDPPNDPEEVLQLIQEYLEDEGVFIGLTSANNFIYRQF